MRKQMNQKNEQQYNIDFLLIVLTQSQAIYLMMKKNVKKKITAKTWQAM